MTGPDVVEFKLVRGANTPVKVAKTKVSPRLTEKEGRTLFILTAHEEHGDDEWIPGKINKVTNRLQHASYQVWKHRKTGVQLIVSDDDEILCVRLNVSRMTSGLPHNGRIVRSQEELDDAVEKLIILINPFLADHDYSIRVNCIEFGGVVEQPFSKFEALLAGRNFPGLRNKPMRFQGETLTYGTGKNPLLKLSFYDKGQELSKQHKTDVPKSTYTRIEFRLKGKKVIKHFGGDTLEDVTLPAMQNVFRELLFKLDIEGEEGLIDFPTSPVGILAMTIYQERRPSPREPVANWYLRNRKNTSYARKQLACAQKMVASRRGETLIDLVPEDAPFVDLGVPEEFSYDQ